MRRRTTASDRTADRAADRGTDHPADDLLGLYFRDLARHDLLDAAEEVALAQATEAGRDAAALLADGDPSDGGDREDRAELERVAAEGRAAFERFVAANLRLVVHIATPYARRSGVELAELVQEGNIGLMRAVERFDWRRGFRFSTLATWWVRQAVHRATAKDRPIHLPMLVHDTLIRARAATARLEAELGRPPDVDEVAAAINATPDRVRDALAVNWTVTSLDAPLDDDPDAATLGALVARAADEPAEEVADRDLVASLLRMARDLLDARSLYVLVHRFGLNGEEPWTLARLARDLGASRDTIRKLEDNALALLRTAAMQTA